MTFFEAMAALDRGEKVTRAAWTDTVYVKVGGRLTVLHEQFVMPGMSTGDIHATDWKIWEQPGHNFTWALAQLSAGKAVTRKYYARGLNIRFGSADMPPVFYYNNSQNSPGQHISAASFQAGDWILWEEDANDR
jgi:hypothetical protein